MDPLRVITGTGTFACTSEADDQPFESAFTLSFFPDGSGVVLANSVPFPVQVLITQDFPRPKFTTFSLHGATEEGTIIDIDEIAATSIAKFSVFSTVVVRYSSESIENCEARYGLTNLRFVGCRYRRRDSRYWLDTVPLSLSGGLLQLHRLPEYDKLVKEMDETRRTRVTAEIECTIPCAERDRWNTVVDDVAWLCSFACSEEVVPVYRDFLQNGQLIVSELLCRHSVPYTGGVRTIPLDVPNPCSLKTFLESGYERYLALDGSIPLSLIIYLFVKGQHPELAIEVQYITMVMALESFCSHTELILRSDHRDIPRRSIERAQDNIRSVVRRRHLPLDEADIEAIAIRAAFPHPDFRDKLRCAFREFSIAYTDDDLASNKTRDAIVHTGKFPDRCDPTEEYFALSNLLIRIILTVLDFRGEYMSRGPRYQTVPLPR